MPFCNGLGIPTTPEIQPCQLQFLSQQEKTLLHHPASLEKLIATCIELGWGLGMEDFESMWWHYGFMLICPHCVLFKRNKNHGFLIHRLVTVGKTHPSQLWQVLRSVTLLYLLIIKWMYKHIVTNLSIWIAKPMQFLLQVQTLTPSEEGLHQARPQLQGCARNYLTSYVHGQLSGVWQCLTNVCYHLWQVCLGFLGSKRERKKLFWQ